jgi:hypothetical protein
MPHLLIFTPTYADKLHPETVRSVTGMHFDGRVTWEIGRHNPHPKPGNANVVAQYQRGRDLFLAGDYDAMLTVEHDMIIPAGAAQALYDTPAQVVYAPYMLRHGSHVLNTWQYCGDRNLGQSLSLYPKELAQLRKQVTGQVSGVGFGCTLIRRPVLERFTLRGEMGSSPDIPFATDCLRGKVLQLARFDLNCGHADDENGGIILDVQTTSGGGPRATVIGVRDVTASVDGQSKRIYPNKRFNIPLDLATELARAGYVRIITDEAHTAERKTATDPATKARSKRGR